MTVEQQQKLLPVMTEAFVSLSKQDVFRTEDFIKTCDTVVPMFEHIGAVFLIARHEFVLKKSTLEEVQSKYPLLTDIVDAGKKDGTITKKNSPARNLHRLLVTVRFLRELFINLGKDLPLKEAVSLAYDETLGKIHAWVVRTGIKAGLVALPSRDTFLEGIQETEESCRAYLEPFTSAAKTIVDRIEKLYDGVTMPKSDITISSLWKK